MPTGLDTRGAFRSQRAFDDHQRMSPRLLNSRETAEYIGRTVDWVRRELPRYLEPVRTAGRRTRLYWRVEDLDWLLAQDVWTPKW